MAAPTPVKTWQIDPNILVAGGPDEHGHAQNLMFAIHSSLVGFGSNPWTVNYSCDSSVAGAAGDNVDRWTVATDIVWNTAAHSWCVYNHPAGPQILFDFDYANHDCEDANVLVSPSGAFAGGDTNNRPTAVDEEGGILANSFIMTTAGVNDVRWSGFVTSGVLMGVDNRVHVWHSDDGLLTRVMIYRNSICAAFWEFGDMGDKRTSQADPFAWGMYVSSNGTVDVSLINYLWVHSWHNSYDAGAAYQMKLMGLGDRTTLWTERAEANIAEEIDSEYHATTVHLWGITVGARGWKGTLIDLWLSPHQAFNPGDNSPNTPAARDFVHCQSIMLPWTGDATVMLIA